MHYKTIILELLKERPQLHRQLRRQRKLLATLESYAQELKASHQEWRERLAQANPQQAATQPSSQAFELALKELEERLPPAPGEQETLSLDQAIAPIRGPSSRG